MKLEVLHWDEKYFYMKHTFIKKGASCAEGTSKGCVYARGAGVVEPTDAFAAVERTGQMSKHDFAFPSLSLRFFPIWRRHWLVWKKIAMPSILGHLADPVIYMLGLGYGLGSLLPTMGGMSYMAFLAAGTVCYSTMNSASFEALYSGFARMHEQRTWEAILNTPVSLDDVVLSEILWAATKSLMSGAAVLVVIWILGIVAFPDVIVDDPAGVADRSGVRRPRTYHDCACACL